MTVNSLVIHAQSQGVDAPVSGNQTNITFCQAIRTRHDSVTLVKQLLHMMAAVQLHRGMSMSLLAGSNLFQSDIQRLQNELENRLSVIETFVGQCDGLLSAQEKNNLQQAWLTIRHDWHDDSLLDNFELQSHFIEQLISMIDGLTQHISKPLVISSNRHYEEATPYPAEIKILELLRFLSPQFIQLIELLAKIRGLATHCAGVGRVEYQQDRKLRYLIQCAKENNERSRHQAKRLSGLWGDQLPSLNDIATAEMKVLFLFNTVETDILSGNIIETESHQLFKLASDIIDTYFNVVDKGWDVIRAQVDKDMETKIRSMAFTS